MANISDKSGAVNAVSVVTRKKPWADLDLALSLHPIRKDIIPLKDDAAIKNAVKNLILTNIYERPFQPQLACNLRGLLFEPADAITRVSLREKIQDVIRDYEPRVSINYINIKNDSNRNAWNVTINFKIKEFNTNTNVQIGLERLR